MGQEQGKNGSQSEAPLGHSRRKNIFTNTPSHSEVASNNGSRVRQQQERPYAQSVVTPVHQYRD